MWERFRCSEPRGQRVLLALAHAVAGVAFVSWVVPFHMKKDTSYPDIGGLSLASYLLREQKQSDVDVNTWDGKYRNNNNDISKQNHSRTRINKYAPGCPIGPVCM